MRVATILRTCAGVNDEAICEERKGVTRSPSQTFSTYKASTDPLRVYIILGLGYLDTLRAQACISAIEMAEADWRVKQKTELSMVKAEQYYC